MNQQPSTSTNCPFCLDNNLFVGEILASSDDAYLSAAHYNPGNYLIIPKRHIESLIQLSDTWWRDVKELLSHVPALPENYNIAMNYGREAGQSVKHLHLWIIPRSPGLATSGKGLAGLLKTNI